MREPDPSEFHARLLDGAVDDLVSAFADEPRVDTPLDGAVTGGTAFRAWADAEARRLAELNASPRALTVTRDAARAVAELVLDVDARGTRVDLPVAVVADLDPEGAWRALRVYHSTWPLTGRHHVRAPLLPQRDDLDEPSAVRAYMTALAAGDVDAVTRLFTPDASVREPSGERFRHAGVDGVRALYAKLLGNGGIVLAHCTATTQDGRTAIEFVAREWGGTPLPPQAGVAVYGWTPDDRLTFARIYDDVEMPGGHA